MKKRLLSYVCISAMGISYLSGCLSNDFDIPVKAIVETVQVGKAVLELGGLMAFGNKIYPDPNFCDPNSPNYDELRDCKPHFSGGLFNIIGGF
jgi:hypothetical protein